MRPIFLSLPSCGILLVGVFALAATTSLQADPPKIIESPTAATAGKATLTITGNGKTQTVEAEGRDVAIEGNGNKITVSGKCHELTISGNGNEVTTGSVVSISTPGNHNHVAYAQAADGTSVQVTNAGAGNEVTKKSE